MTDPTKERWKTIFTEFDSSGLSAVEYCRQNGVNLQVFYNTRWKLKNSTTNSRSACREPLSPFSDPAGSEIRFVQVFLES
ncbi:IS66 family insertion sequence element accessory protein TnpA [Faecalibaculum rodentium]|uniref:IS66 family insertion sequence element accessory protein TnpA n=1 Tax=Faecalibaculum rodentium TaxID=1702221 RepID=UPI003C6D8DB5